MKFKFKIVGEFEMSDCVDAVAQWFKEEGRALPPSKSELIEYLKATADNDMGAMLENVEVKHLQFEILDCSDTDELTEDEAQD